MRSISRASCFGIALLAFAATGRAEDDATRSRARELAQQGMDAAKRGEHERARDYLHRAYTLVPAPTIAVREARSLRELGRWVDAVEAYVRATRTPAGVEASDAFKQAAVEAEAELAQLRPRVPKLHIQIEGVDPDSPGLRVAVDGKPWSLALVGVPSPIDPGKHVVVVRTRSGREKSAEVVIAERESKQVTLRLPPEPVQSAKLGHTRAKSLPAETQKPDRTLAFVGFGVGVVGVAVGVGAGLASTKQYHAAESSCPDGGCAEVDSFRKLRTISTIGYVAGAVGIGAGVTLWLTAPRPSQSARTGVYLGATSAGVRGSFR